MDWTWILFLVAAATRVHSFQDPQESGRKLPQLCTELQTTIHDIILECVYCKQQLLRREVYDRDLCIVYRDGNPYAVCDKCLKFYSKISEYRHYCYSLYGTTLEQQYNKPLCDLLIRCINCQKPLQRHLDKKQRFHNIRGRWTGRCMSCCRSSRTRRETQLEGRGSLLTCGDVEENPGPHGDTPTLHEYMLDLQPETTDLYGYGQLNDSSEEEDEIDGPAGQAEPDRAHYNIVTFCCKCDSTLRLCVQSTHVDIRTLEDLLMGTLGIVCPICSQKPEGRGSLLTCGDVEENPGPARFEDPTRSGYKLPDLCTELNTSLQDIEITCVYCKTVLELTEVFEKDLFVVYRDSIPHAACHKCIDFYSRIRELRHYSDSVYGDTLEKLTNTGLYNLLIRCLRCQKPLLRHLNEKRRFHNIAGHYRGQCHSCCNRARQERLQRRRETQVEGRGSLLTCGDVEENPGPHGPKATLQDIVLHLEPQNEIPVDLLGHGQLSDSEEENDEIDGVNHQHLPARRAEPQRHTMLCMCCKCEARIELVVESSADDLRAFQQLFLNTLSFVCPWCASQQ